VTSSNITTASSSSSVKKKVNPYSNLPDCPSPGRKHNCYGTYTWADGRKYIGEFKDNELHGKGSLSFSNEDVYIGEWRNNLRNGHFNVYYENGNTYTGQLKDNCFHGLGVYTFASGKVKKGRWKDCRLVQEISSTTTASSSSSVKKKTCSEDATLCNETALCKKASWRKWRKGQVWDDDRKVTQYVAEAKRRELTCGVKTTASSSSGNCGSNIKVCSKKELCFEGTFLNNAGLSTWQNNEEAREAKRRGLNCGVNNRKTTASSSITRENRTFSDGTKYVGGIKNGKEHGQGTYIWRDGLVAKAFVGNWKNGKAKGEGL
jgi:hypothetical protein